jgi:hypothetical protein
MVQVEENLPSLSKTLSSNPNTKDGRGEDTDRIREGHVEMGVMQPQAKECLASPKAGKDKEPSPLESLWGRSHRAT